MSKNTETSRQRDRQMDHALWERFHSAEGKAARRKNVRIGFAITLVLLVLATVINWGVVTGWGNVRIDRIKLIGTDGAEYSALVYVPKNATDKTPAPGMLCFHGNAGNARNHESWAVEFARRGFVVLSVDQFGAGDSQGHFDGGKEGALNEANNATLARMFYQYFLTMPIVDTENILSTGHSMGGGACNGLGAEYGAKAILGASTTSQAANGYQGDYLYVKGLVEVSDMEKEKKQMLAVLNSREGFEDVTEFEYDHVYGSFEEGNGFIAILEPNRIHEAASVSRQTIGNLLKYGQLAIGDAVPNYIDPADQVWMVKDFTGLFGIFAFGAFLCALALLLIEEVPVFEAVKRPIPRNIGMRGPGLAISIILAVVFPYLVLKTDAFGIIGGRFYENLKAWGFNMGYTNMGFGVVIGLNLCGLAGFMLYLATDGRKDKLKIDDLGLTPESFETADTLGAKILCVLGQVLRTTALSAIVVAIAWAYVQFTETIFGTDFYAWFFGIKDIPINKIPYFWNYLIVWILCFVIASFGMNVERHLPTTGKEWLDIVLAMVFNIFLATFVITTVVAVKWHLQTIGSPADTNFFWKMGVDTQRIWGMPVGMAIGVGGSTFLYKKTGNTWLSAILMGTVACLMGVLFGSTRFHFLTFFVQ